MKKIVYHGTNEKAAEQIKSQGFKAWSWFATHLEDAIAFGGEYIFSVAYEDPPVNWQFMSPYGILPDRIVSLSKIDKAVLHENKELREEIFAENMRGIGI